MKKKSILNYNGIVYKQKDNKIVYTDNTGESYYSLIYCLCKKNNYEAIHCKIFQECECEGYFLTYFINGLQRTIQSYDDGGKWVFYNEGPVQDFEYQDYYKNKIKKKRFNYNIIEEYLSRIDIKINDNEFWKPIGKVWNIKRIANL